MIDRLGATRSTDKGFAPSTYARYQAMLSRALAIGLSIAALLFGAGGLMLGFGEPSLTGLLLESPGGHVTSVDPTSLAWAAGIRAGQVVVRETDASEAGGWSIVTTSDGLDHGLSQSAAAASLRIGLIPAAAATLAGLAGFVVSGRRRRRRRGESLGTIGLVLSTLPFAVTHDPAASPIVAAASLACGIWAIRWWSPAWFGAFASAAVLAVNVAALIASALGLDAIADLIGLRFDATIALGIGIVAIGFGVTPRVVSQRSAAIRYADVAAAAVAIGLATFVALVFAPPLWAPLAAVVVVMLGYRGIRRQIRRWIDRVVFAEERERIAIGSAESERARLSRELHDDPLQALAGVILSLEDQPDTERERETLRTVAGQLRNIATSLHPPVLDDLGLVPAVESLFADIGPIPIEIDLVNTAGFGRADRPPFDVELASYRIVAEAATNALRHSGCQRIVVRGTVGPEVVAIDVVDDGRGINDREVEVALRDGHLGVASMRRRAEAIDAELAHLSGPGEGTTVRLRWSG
jgi:signal transduction histidine kinase